MEAAKSCPGKLTDHSEVEIREVGILFQNHEFLNAPLVDLENHVVLPKLAMLHFQTLLENSILLSPLNPLADTVTNHSWIMLKQEAMRSACAWTTA